MIMATNTMFPPLASRPISQAGQAYNLDPIKTNRPRFAVNNVAILRDNFTVPVWIVLGCITQYLLALCMRPSLAILPAFIFISWSITDALLMTAGFKKNTWATNVISTRFSVAYPAPGGGSTIGELATNGPGAVFILGARSHSPLGLLAPGYREIGRRFRHMIAQCEKDNTAGFMGMSSWIGTERSSGNEATTISYWRSVDDIHAFAMSPVHRDAWNWWTETVAKGGNKNVGIMHEVFEVRKRNGFEGIYVNYHPTGLAATTRLVEGEGGKSGGEWVVPIVDATKGIFKSSRGRLGRGG